VIEINMHETVITNLSDNYLKRKLKDLPVEGFIGKSAVTLVASTEEVLRLIKLVALLQLVSISDENIGV
jgi:hypothetical protein